MVQNYLKLNGKLANTWIKMCIYFWSLFHSYYDKD